MKDFKVFQKLLDEHYQWPVVYTFKFIVPKTSATELLSVFDVHAEVKARESKKGNYLSITAKMIMSSSDSVISVYEAVANIEGIISL